MTASNATLASREASSSSDNRDDSSSVLQQQCNSATSAPSANTVAGQRPARKKRNLPGTPDPDAEVIALSPKTLMATNRFVCEICGKGFQRDQNLQLHRRGHNLPWKLRQRSSKEPRKRVYICPEPSCVHHHPSRALGDLTGIKKHFSRKHGEKKWKCDKCNKRYAVQSDWKAHSKTCGTREYRCDCGTLFSRRDSFITHRAFCDALGEESGRSLMGKHGAAFMPGAFDSLNHSRGASGASGVPHEFYDTHMPAMSSDPIFLAGKSGLDATIVGVNFGDSQSAILPSSWAQGSRFHGLDMSATGPRLSLWSLPEGVGSKRSGEGAVGGRVKRTDVSSFPSGGPQSLVLKPFSSGFSLPGLEACTSRQGGGATVAGGSTDIRNRLDPSASTGLSLSSPHFALQSSVERKGATSVVSNTHIPSSTHMSATALLQKAALIGATASNFSFPKDFGISGFDSSSFGLRSSWQYPRQDPEMISQPQQSQTPVGEISAKNTGSGSSSGPPDFLSVCRSADKSSKQGLTATSISTGYAGLFGGALSTFPPIFATHIGNEGVSQLRNTSDGKPPASRSSDVQNGADTATRDFLGASKTEGTAECAQGPGKTLSHKDLAKINSIDL